MTLEWIKTLWRCLRHRWDARYWSWRGLQRILPRRKGGWGVLGRPKDRLVKGMRIARAKTIEPANPYLDQDDLVWWDRELTVVPANSDDAHRRWTRATIWRRH